MTKKRKPPLKKLADDAIAQASSIFGDATALNKLLVDRDTILKRNYLRCLIDGEGAGIYLEKSQIRLLIRDYDKQIRVAINALKRRMR